jgi:hypothetical protein
MLTLVAQLKTAHGAQSICITQSSLNSHMLGEGAGVGRGALGKKGGGGLVYSRFAIANVGHDHTCSRWQRVMWVK